MQLKKIKSLLFLVVQQIFKADYLIVSLIVFLVIFLHNYLLELSHDLADVELVGLKSF